jgi:hypothetical protein
MIQSVDWQLNETNLWKFQQVYHWFPFAPSIEIFLLASATVDICSQRQQFPEETLHSRRTCMNTCMECMHKWKGWGNVSHAVWRPTSWQWCGNVTLTSRSITNLTWIHGLQLCRLLQQRSISCTASDKIQDNGTRGQCYRVLLQRLDARTEKNHDKERVY